jgi:hypothetical protein
MVFLKKITTAVFVLMLASYVGCAQTDDDMQKAFKASYASEYKGDYNGAISALQSGYKADSYECNVRMGWHTTKRRTMESRWIIIKRQLMIRSIALKQGLDI